MTLPPSYDHLPIIDLSAADRGPQARTLLHAQLHSAAHDVGSFQLVGHGVPRAEREALLTATRAFFALPEADRLALDKVNSPHFRGYTGGVGGRCERFDIGPERPACVPGPGEPAYGWLEGPNQWPAALPALRTAALAWIDRLSGVARRLLRELLTAIGAPAGFYDPVLGERAHPRLRLVRPAGSAGDGTGRAAGAHQDRGFLTLLLQDTVCGFPEVLPLDGAFVVGIGDLLEAATDGYLIAADHRALGPTGRFSVPFFCAPRLDARVAPPPFPYAGAAPGFTAAPDDPLGAEYGHHALKDELRAHPRVARRHHGKLLAAA
ncbi:2-oxoglutarate and iron-dependent oxygenase domain-containing protein [Streptomyces sp. NPDC001508]|uniref:isopenicillin N synthase family dioxygenase n=1 Tax=Streptomyces sp. NPDC001508 TaxID=3154656 RepID=UPI003317A5A3